MTPAPEKPKKSDLFLFLAAAVLIAIAALPIYFAMRTRHVESFPLPPRKPAASATTTPDR